jgi:hippurate hydrolase
VGSIHGGTTGNIIPDSVELRGTVRSYDPAVRQKIAEGIARTAKAAAAMGGAPEPQVQIIPGVDAVINDAALVERTEAVFKAAFDPAKVEHVPPIAPSDDFSQFGSTGVPEMFFLVGVYDPKQVEASKAPGGKPLPVNHSPFFAPVPEPTIKTSVKAMSIAVLAALDR